MHLIKSIISTFLNDKIAGAMDHETRAEAGTRLNMMTILLEARNTDREKNTCAVVVDERDMLHHVVGEILPLRSNV